MPSLFLCPTIPELQRPSFNLSHCPILATMSRSGSEGKWVASTATEKDIKELWEAKYLTAEITHMLIAKEQIIPTPEPDERVVFIPHFLRGLGFPLHPFVRGQMFCDGLDFHDLAPNSFLHISTTIVVCEVLLRIPPPISAYGSKSSM